MGKTVDWAARLEQHQRDRDTESARALIGLLRREGFALSICERGILVSPASKMSEQRKELLRMLKPAVLAVLAVETASAKNGSHR